MTLFFPPRGRNRFIICSSEWQEWYDSSASPCSYFFFYLLRTERLTQPSGLQKLLARRRVKLLQNWFVPTFPNDPNDCVQWAEQRYVAHRQDLMNEKNALKVPIFLIIIC